ncbi:hypothetical protein G7068_16020 [Leucobacter viscericola]|uniref:Uncharacterized protein n=1 Tax=Leucobacter viscericola TaxID=2714935 RepID=A0A6G7XJ27_9MICO|nr:hypothetical protein [Leucobacter viscericola]QIK64553.1 hypothetical protein G7068_16020 [Leucobacter viscericola]
MIDRYEDAELEVETYRDRSHSCDYLQSFVVPEISLEVVNVDLADECDGCARELNISKLAA